MGFGTGVEVAEAVLGPGPRGVSLDHEEVRAALVEAARKKAGDPKLEFDRITVERMSTVPVDKYIRAFLEMK